MDKKERALVATDFSCQRLKVHFYSKINLSTSPKVKKSSIQPDPSYNKYTCAPPPQNYPFAPLLGLEVRDGEGEWVEAALKEMSVIGTPKPCPSKTAGSRYRDRSRRSTGDAGRCRRRAAGEGGSLRGLPRQGGEEE